MDQELHRPATGVSTIGSATLASAMRVACRVRRSAGDAFAAERCWTDDHGEAVTVHGRV